MLTYEDALDYCNSLNASLFEPRNGSDVHYLYEFYIEHMIVWVGITDRFENGKYVYETTQLEVDMEIDWFPMQPDNSTEEKFVTLQLPEMKFADRDSEFKAMGLCQKFTWFLGQMQVKYSQNLS